MGNEVSTKRVRFETQTYNNTTNKRLHNCHHTYNSNDTEMQKLIQKKFESKKKFKILLDKLLPLSIDINTKQFLEPKKVIRCLRLLHTWMTLAINQENFWIFKELATTFVNIYHKFQAFVQQYCDNKYG